MVQALGDEGLREIHRGRRYVVLRQWKQDGERLVVKRVREGPLASGSGAMLRHEYALLCALHPEVPGVARAVALREDTLPSLILEDAGPQNLQEWLGRRPVAMDAFLELALQLAGIIASLHQQHVIHRDLNPTNIVVSAGSRHVTLIDFDLATQVAGVAPDGGMTSELQWALPYIAPEQTGRMNRPIDHRADLYSLGATFYELLTGLPPFVSMDPVELVHAHLAKPPVPPAFANPAVPKLLSDLVLKLLAKMPEERYQSAEALLADLLEARRRQASGAMGSFELGRVDLARQLTFPPRLYGRERELAALHETLERVRQGASEGVLLVGEPGIGKSALIQELRRRAAPGDLVLQGKFGQLQRNMPYAGFVEAFQGLLHPPGETLPEARAALRHRVLQAVGPYGRVLEDVVPGLEALVGPLPVPPGLGPAETAARLHLSLQAFVQALAPAGQVLVLFLDDLHWADPGSLQLFQSLATAPESRGVLLVGAYRPREVSPDHPLPRLLEALWKAQTLAFQLISLGPLDLASVTALCADTFRCGPEQARPLAELVLRKTAGNPLFITRFLRLLHHSGLLVFDLDHGTWSWDLARLEQVEVTENVVELMMATIRRLPGRAQQALKVAACLGDRVELWLLSALMDDAGDDAAPAVWSLLREGLLVPEREGTGPPRGDGGAPGEAPAPEAVYRFAHDRVRQAAYSLLSHGERQHLHRAAARGLLRGAGGGTLDERLFAVVDHLHLGGARPGDTVEGLEVAELDLRAGLKAKAASAFGAALVYLLRGVTLLPAPRGASRREQVFRLHKEAAECAYFSSDASLAGALARTALEYATSRLDQVELRGLQVLALVMSGDYVEALQRGGEGLRLFGLELPEGDLGPALEAELAEAEAHLRGRSEEELLEAPCIEDPEQLACVRLLSDLTIPAYFVDPRLFALLNTRALNLTLKHGSSTWAPAVYGCHGMLLSNRGDDADGYGFGHLGVALARRNGDPRQESRVLVSFTLHLNHWKEPLRTGLPLLRRAVALGIASGDLQFASYASTTAVSTEFAMGVELARVRSSIEACQALLRRSNVPTLSDVTVIYMRALRALQGRTRRAPRPGDVDAEEPSCVDSPQAPAMNRYLDAMQRLLVAYLLGDTGEALRMSEAAVPHARFVKGFFRTADHNLLTSLALAARATAAPGTRAEALERIATNQRQLGAWAEGCPENFRHKHQLVAAEVARLEGRYLEAMALYDRAIDGAHAEGFLHDEAMANELAGRCYHALGRKRFAAPYLRAALEVYARWGARAKVSLLEEEFPDLESMGSRAWSEPESSQVKGGRPAASLDLLSLLKASETLVGEVVLDRLLEKLMAVCLEAAGATRGTLALDEGGRLMVRARGAVSEPVGLERLPLASSDVPATVVEHAWRTGETLVLADAAHQGRFTTDPSVVRRAVKSALAVPIQRQGWTVGVLYLENELTTRAFPPERVGVLRALSSQMAISLENSRLFEQLEVEVRERRRAEAAVRFLAESGLALAESLDLEQTLAKATRLMVPFLADWCVFTLAEEGQRLRMLAIAHVDPEKEVLLRAFLEKYPPDWSSPPGLVQALRTGRPVLRAELTSELLEQAGHGPGYVEALRAVGARTAMHVPLIARGKTLGVITLGSGTYGRRYAETDLELARELARRAAICIDNARLYRASQEAVRLRDDFLSVASHELNTPVTSLRLMAQSLLRHVPDGMTEPALRALRTLDAQSLKLATLIEELLDVSRLHAGRLELNLDSVDLREVIHRVAERLREPLARAGCTLEPRVEGPVRGRWDAARLTQVLLNLLFNAIKFGAGKPITVAAGAEGGTAWLSVQDLGIGIAPDRLPHIFERFERAVSVRAYGGLGLGLHVVREVVTALGGGIHVESTVGVGTTFTVELPCAGPPDEAPGAHPGVHPNSSEAPETTAPGRP